MGKAVTGQRLCVYTRAWQSGGAGLFARELVDGLLENGASVTFISPVCPDPRFETPRAGLKRLRPPRETPGKSKLSNRLRGVGRIMASIGFLIWARLSTRTYLISIPDVLPVTLPVLAVLRATGARIIFIVHDPLPHAWKLPPALRGLERGAHEACYALASAAVVLSEPSRSRMAQAFPRLSTPVHVIEHGVFVMGEPTPMPGNGVLLIFGSLRRNKGILEGMQGVIAARARGVPVRLIVAGGPHREERDYAALLTECAISAPDAIDLRMGYVEDDAVRTLLAESDALLLPYTDFHSQSGVALLAASNARPIIASPAGGIGTLMAEGMPSAPIAQPVSPDTVAEAVAAFMATPTAIWNERAGRYLAHTLKVRSWRAIAAQYLVLAARL